jgi:hypothetical protein
MGQIERQLRRLGDRATHKKLTLEAGSGAAIGDMSGSGTALPQSRPLRTVREPLGSYGSSLSHVVRGTEDTAPAPTCASIPGHARWSVRCQASSNFSNGCCRSVASLPPRPVGSLHPFGLGMSRSRRPYLLHYETAFAFSDSPLPPPPSPALRYGYRHLAVAGRVGLTLLSNVEMRMGRLRPIVRWVTVPPSSMGPIDEPTHMPFWPRPVSTFGRFTMTDLNHGRSLAFSLPSSAGPRPDWCFQSKAVVPEASHVGLLRRMSG